MLILHLALDKGQITVHANEVQSHSFSLHDLSMNDAELKAFVLNPRLYGSRLFLALFKDGSAVKTAFDELSKQSARTIVLVLDSPELDGVAWEYAYNDIKQEYVVEECAFMRALPESERPANGRLKESVERVSLLFIPANPLVDLNAEPMRALDVEGEWREMTRHITASNAPFDLLQLRPATPEQLQISMARFRDGLVVHFSGHGAAMKNGTILLFERENGASNPLGAQEFIRAVKYKAAIVFLSACQSAAAEKTEFGNLARGLVKSGVPFALGMQFNLPDPFAPIISGQFYNWLAQGHAVPEAARQARRAVKRENEFYVGMIALYASDPDEVGKMGWTGSGAHDLSDFTKADVEILPVPREFIGRQRELMNIGTHLLGKKKPNTVTLHGAGGIGKTALMRQALLRFAPSFEATFAIALDPLPSLESVLGRLERFLNLPSPCSNDIKERERILRERLTGGEMLLGLDNFETLNYALNEKGNDEEKTAKSLHAFFKSLAANGVPLCATSREVTNLPGEAIEDIQGLTNENGGRLFQENIVGQKDEIYIEKTQQVSEMVGGHPLALRLLASAFDDQVGTSLDQYIEDLQSHLPKARDKWTEEDRHESLRASFDFTMDKLVKTEEGKKLQIAQARLGVFIAFFYDQMAAPVLENHVPESMDEFEKMHPKVSNTLNALWERGLLERIDLKSADDHFYLYRLHPALKPFTAVHIASEDIHEMQELHWRVMYQLARNSYPKHEYGGIYGSPLMVVIVRYALPDMLKATSYKQDKETSTLLFRLAFLHEYFGELDVAIKLHQQSLEIRENLGDLRGKGDTLHSMAGIYTTRGNLVEAMSLYQQVLKISEETGNMEDKSTTLHSIANIYITRGDMDMAMELYQQSLEIKESLGDLQGKPATLYQIAKIHEIRGNLDDALNLYQQALKISEETNILHDKAATLHAIGNIYMLRDDLDSAMRFYEQSLDIHTSLDDLDGKSGSLYGIAGIYAARGNLEYAIELHQQVLSICERLGNLQKKSSVLHAMGNVFMQGKNLNEALILFQQALKIDEELGDLKSKSVVLHDIGCLLFARNSDEDALKTLLSALEIQIQLNLRLDIEETIFVINMLKEELGVDAFQKLWWQTTGNQKLPEWVV